MKPLRMGKVRVISDSGRSIRVVLLEHRQIVLWIPKGVLAEESKRLGCLDVAPLVVYPFPWWIQGMGYSDRENFEDVRVDVDASEHTQP